jgi:group I intron endonuclease
MIGIYKITNPIGEVYIGQSKNIKKRFLTYINNNGCSPKIYNSILDYGFENHTFEILSKCTDSDLKHLEAFFIKKYDSCNNGLNSYSLIKNLPKNNINPIEENIILKANRISIGKIEVKEIQVNNFINQLQSEAEKSLKK